MRDEFLGQNSCCSNDDFKAQFTGQGPAFSGGRWGDSDGTLMLYFAWLLGLM